VAAIALHRLGGNLVRAPLPPAVIEVFAAAVGAGIGIAASGVGNLFRRDSEASLAVVRLTSAVEHIAGEVSLLRQEIKEDRQELYPRIGSIEQRLAALEAKA
jgi:hypothetical protein